MDEFWFVGVPLFIVWVITLLDIARHSGSPQRKILWSLACTVVWPVIIAWYLLRPTPGRLAAASHQTDDRRQEAVSAVLARSNGQISGDEFRERMQQLAAEDPKSAGHRRETREKETWEKG